MFTFLLIVHAIIAAALVTVILMQRSEGGGLGMGGSPSGLMSARGAADFLTRATTVLATLFVLMSILLAVMATVARAPSTIDASLAHKTPASAPDASVPLAGDPLAAAAAGAGPSGLANGAAPLTATPVVPAPATVRDDPAADTGRAAHRAVVRATEPKKAEPAAPAAPKTDTGSAPAQ